MIELSGHEFGLVGRRQAGLEPGVDAILLAPVLYGLAADLQIRGHLLHGPADLQQV